MMGKTWIYAPKLKKELIPGNSDSLIRANPKEQKTF